MEMPVVWATLDCVTTGLSTHDQGALQVPDCVIRASSWWPAPAGCWESWDEVG
jgi:hypothetical protein